MSAWTAVTSGLLGAWSPPLPSTWPGAEGLHKHSQHREGDGQMPLGLESRVARKRAKRTGSDPLSPLGRIPG